MTLHQAVCAWRQLARRWALRSGGGPPGESDTTTTCDRARSPELAWIEVEQQSNGSWTDVVAVDA